MSFLERDYSIFLFGIDESLRFYNGFYNVTLGYYKIIFHKREILGFWIYRVGDIIRSEVIRVVGYNHFI